MTTSRASRAAEEYAQNKLTEIVKSEVNPSIVQQNTEAFLAGVRFAVEEARKIAGPCPDTEDEFWVESLEALLTEEGEICTKKT